MKTALLLAGGLATRLGEISISIPKACVKVNDLSPLAFLLPRLAQSGVTRAWINLHHHTEQIQREAKRFCPPQLELRWLHEETLLGTGGTLLEATQQNGSLPDVVLNAKMYTDFQWHKILTCTEPTLVLHSSSDLEIFGGFRYDEKQQITSLRKSGAPSQTHDVGVYTGICRPSEKWLASISEAPNDAPSCLIRHGLLKTLPDQPVRAMIHSGSWCEISTPKRVQIAEETLASILATEKIPCPHLDASS